MIIGFIGLPRSGKTLLQTIITYICFKQGMEIYSNYKLMFESELINPNVLLEFALKNCVVDLDEVSTILDARVNSKGARLLSYFIMQSGKRDVHILWTAQLIDMVDDRLVDVTAIIIKCRKTEIGFIYEIVNRFTGKSKTITLTFERASKFYNMYDTTEVIYPMDIKPTGKNLDFNKMVKDVLSAPTKKSFMALVRTDNPWIPESTAQGIYDFIRSGDIDKAKRLLRLEIGT